MKYKIPIISSLLYLVFSLVYLYINGYHEDAYILFNYSENLSNFGQISYYPDGPPAEGATDFLWMIIISLLYSLKIPTFLSVSILNSIGAYVISYVLVSFLESRISKQSLILCSISWIFSLGVVSSLSGFSTVFYNSVFLLSLLSLYHKRRIVPYLLLILSLIRPDGVVLSFGIFLITVFWKPFNSGFYKTYFFGYIFSGVIGLIYFLWRWNYFGELLPLPLYVKSNSNDSSFPGLVSNLSFILYNFYLFLLIFILFKTKKENISRYLPIIVPGTILFISLLFAHQSQNVGFRFQYPLWISSLLLLLILITDNHNLKRNKYFIIFIGAAVILQSLKFYKNISKSNSHYIDDFSINFLQNFNKPNERIKVALTEAGRLTYWLTPIKPIVSDLIGLNTLESSKFTISDSYLTTFDPDLIFFHHAGVLHPKKDVNSLFVKIENSEDLLMKTEFSHIRENDVSFIILKFLLKEFKSYNIYLVDYTENGTFSHVYALKKSSELDSVFLKSLTPSFNQKRTFFDKLDIRENYKF